MPKKKATPAIRVGDVVFIERDSLFMEVLEVTKTKLRVVDGNFHWWIERDMVAKGPYREVKG